MSFLYESYPIITLVPLLVMLVLVAVTKRVFESLIVALALVFILKDGTGFFTGFMDSVYDVFAEGTYPWIVMMLALFGGLIALLIKSGGISAFRNFAQRFIKSERSSLVFTWVLGMILFIDDYINNLGIGPTVRGLTDKYKVPREQLGFSICCTGTPVCALVPLTAFAMFVFGVMKDYGVSGENANMLTEYLKIIPFMFYPIVIIVVSLLLALGVLPRFGAFKKYYNELREGTYSLSEEETKEVAEESGEEIDVDVPGAKLIDFVLPVVVLVVVMFVNQDHDLVMAVVAALLVAFIMYIPRKKMKISEFFETFFEGFQDMIFILSVVLMTFVFVEGLNAVGFNEFVVSVVEPVLTGGAIPALTFIAVGVVAFLGVDYWAVMLLIAPIALPLSEQFSVSPYVTMAAIVSGSVFGGTACFFAEQILMCSQAVQRPPVRVALGGLPYSILAAVVTIVLYLVFGFAL
jgi:Na+/H+ antiporter NhaC